MPGVVALVTYRQRGALSGRLRRDRRLDRPLTSADALFRIASMTKAITSSQPCSSSSKAARLDDPVANYLPEFANLKVIESFDAATGA